MLVTDLKMIEAWKHVLHLSKLEAGQAVSILTDPNSNAQTFRTATIAAQSMGAKVTRIDLSPCNEAVSLSPDKTAYVGETALTGNKAALAALKASDLVIDQMLLLFSPEQGEVLSGGTKILLAVEPPEVLLRILPTMEDRETVLSAARKLEHAKLMRVTSAAGTEVEFPLGRYPILTEYGFVDEPGRWDHWPAGFVATWANDGQSQGKIVLDRGDIWTPRLDFIASPIEITVRDGYVTKIDGGFDADLLAEYMETFEDPDAYAISHVGWGLQKRAKWPTLAMYNRESTIGMDARAFAGNFLCSLGPNNEVGGANASHCHIDIPMRKCTVELDGEVVVKDGKLQ